MPSFQDSEYTIHQYPALSLRFELGYEITTLRASELMKALFFHSLRAHALQGAKAQAAKTGAYCRKSYACELPGVRVLCTTLNLSRNFNRHVLGQSLCT